MEFLYNHQILKIKKKVLLFNFQDELLSEIDKNNARAFPNQEKLNQWKSSGNVYLLQSECPSFYPIKYSGNALRGPETASKFIKQSLQINYWKTLKH